LVIHHKYNIDSRLLERYDISKIYSKRKYNFSGG